MLISTCVLKLFKGPHNKTVLPYIGSRRKSKEEDYNNLRPNFSTPTRGKYVADMSVIMSKIFTLKTPFDLLSYGLFLRFRICVFYFRSLETQN